MFEILTDQDRLPEWSPEVIRSEVVDEPTRTPIVDHTETQPFVMEIQILGDRVAVCSGRRNHQANSVGELERFLALARAVG